MIHKPTIQLIFFGMLVGSLQAQTNKPQSSITQVPAPAATVVARPSAYSSASQINYVRVRQAKYPFVQVNQFNGANMSNYSETTNYIDGLGRSLQSVQKQAAPGQKDMVTATQYDGFGRTTYQYLPFAVTSGTQSADGTFKTDPFALQEQFYQQQSSLAGEQVYYQKVQYESSPLLRTEKNMPAGNSWAGSNRGTTQTYLFNTSSDSVRIWSIGFDTLSYNTNDDHINIPSTQQLYAAGLLYKNLTEDEQGYQVIEYKDKQDKVLLKKVQIEGQPSYGHIGWLSTYYVYDDLGQLRFVIPPKAVQLIQDNNWQISTTVTHELCFRYEYDAQGRMIGKKVPGSGWVYMVYDERDRLCYTQDANLRSQNKWMVQLYDGLNRLRVTGMIHFTGNRQTLQNWVNTNFNNTLGNLSITTNSGTEQITIHNNSLPSGHNLQPLSIQYYDHYQHTSRTYATGSLSKLVVDPLNTSYAEPLPSNAKAIVSGMATGSKVRVLQNPSDLSQGGWLETVSFYDDKGRVIQVQSDNYTGAADTITNRYDFEGKVITSYGTYRNQRSNDWVRVLTQNSYDTEGRLMTIAKILNDSSHQKRRVVRNQYNDLGQLIQKRVGQVSATDTTALEIQDYVYNIRGWLQGVNKAYSRGTGKRWFGMELNYDWGFAQSQYNGNIAGMQWRSGGDATRRTYGYGYDRANRLLFGDFAQDNGSDFADIGAFNFDVLIGDGLQQSSAYDANGNILRMQQWGMKGNGSTKLDDLQYTYRTQSNQLKNVLDASNDSQTRSGDFRSSPLYMQSIGTKTTAAEDYSYDANGNLLKDLNKDIVTVSGSNGIVYNHLNLPSSVVIKKDASNLKGTIRYIYDASGNKLQKQVIENADTTTTWYAGGLVYQNDSLQFLSHEEGRIRRNGKGQLVFDYFLKDHLGNTRVVLTDEQQVDPYPVASLETSSLASEQLYYSIPDAAGVRVEKAAVPGYPTDNYTDPNQYVHKLNGNGTKVGTSMVLKVMQGDSVRVRANSWYRLNGVTPDQPANPLEELIAALAGGISRMSSVKFSYTELVQSGVLSPGMTELLNTQSYTSTKPKAYLNWALFDEHFQLVGSSSGFDQVGSDDEFKTHFLPGIPITKNGYLYIYVSNETPNVDVFFDNVQVTHVRGPLLEETHYYPFGLTMTGISSKAAGKMENRYKYNGIELNEDLGLNTYDAFFRNLDPQIGKWWQIDPKVEGYENISPYASNNNDPIRYSDPLGDEGDDDGIFSRAWQNFKNNLSAAQNKVYGLIIQGISNAKNNWDNGTTLPQILARDFHENPLSAITGIGPLKGPLVKAPFVKQEVKIIEETKIIDDVIEHKPVDYSNLKEPKKVGEGLATTKAQRDRILEANRKANGGVLKSDKSGKVLDVPVQSKKGVKANMNQAEVDHVIPKSKRGTNSNANLQVLSKEENLKKRNNL